MNPPHESKAVPTEEVLATVCARFGIRQEDRFLVRALTQRPKSQWPGCCGAGCEPCMDDVAAAAEAALETTHE